MSYILKFKNNYKYMLITSILVFFFSFSFANAKSAPESFADLAEKLSPSVVNISTTTIVEQKQRDMPSFPPASLSRRKNNLTNLEIKKEELNHLDLAL